MSEPIWNQFLTERDKAVFAASGYGARGGFGKRPALLVIDVNYAFCGDKPEPILESIKRWRNSCGEESWPAVAAIKSLVDKAHEKGIPVIYTTGGRRVRPAMSTATRSSRKSRRHLRTLSSTSKSRPAFSERI
jgi:maleamate amidohydrolase